MKHIEVISLIYKSCDYARHISNELKETTLDIEGWEYSYRLVANDPTPDLPSFLVRENIPHTIYNDPYPHDHYLSRVYRAWNHAGATSKADLVVFVNSDMAFTPNWLNALLHVFQQTDGKTIPCSMLIESGKIPSGSCLKPMNFGQTLKTLNKAEFLLYCEQFPSTIQEEIRCVPGGLFMPCLLRQEHFDPNSNLHCTYPEGNMYSTGAGTRSGDFIMSGDQWYFRNLKERFGLDHISVPFPVFHIQEGEMDESP